MESGWIKINRGLSEWGWYKDANTARVFLDILIHTNYQDGEYMGHKIKAGQCVIGRKALSERLGISEQSVRTALTHLKSTGEITIESTNKFSIATVAKWDKYQCKDDEANQQNNQQANQQLTNNQPTTNQQLTTSKKERKKERKNIYTSEFDEVWEKYPKKHGKQDAKKHYIKAREDGVSREDIEKGIEAYKEYIKATGTEDRYVKAGSSFFCQRAWENDWTVSRPKEKPRSNVYQPEPPKYPEFEPEPEVKSSQMPDYVRARIGEIFG